jgi:chemotaxis protein CheX
MKAEYINPFFQATRDVFNMMLDLETNKAGDLSVVEEMIPGSEANVVIGVTGDLYGSILYSFPKDMTLEMVKIMSGMEMEKIDSFVTSALGEVANIISSNALTYLSQKDYICDVAPPQIIVSENRSLSMATDKALKLPLKTTIGEFEINISLAAK